MTNSVPGQDMGIDLSQHVKTLPIDILMRAFFDSGYGTKDPLQQQQYGSYGDRSSGLYDCNGIETGLNATITQPQIVNNTYMNSTNYVSGPSELAAGNTKLFEPYQTMKLLHGSPHLLENLEMHRNADSFGWGNVSTSLSYSKIQSLSLFMFSHQAIQISHIKYHL